MPLPISLIVVFVVVVVIQLIYWTLFLIAVSKKRAVSESSGEGVSVVVCAHDEENNLRQLIPSLLQQNYPKFEVIVVNDRSNDGTYDYLLEATKLHPKLKMVNVKDTPAHVNSKKYALTLGIRAAANDWVLLTDADCRPQTDEWIHTMSRSFNGKAQFVLGFSPYNATAGFLNHFIRFESLVTALQYFTFAIFNNPYMGVGRNLAYRKSLFLEKKGFNNLLHVTGGDDDLFVNLHANGNNTRVEFSATSLVTSIPEKTFRDFFHQKVRHLSIGKRYRFGHKLLLSAFNLSWILTWITGVWLILLGFTDYRLAIAGVSGIFLRWMLAIFSVRAIAKTSKLSFTFAIIPVLDFLYPIYYISTGLVALFTKKVRWKR
jgi:cellulose synthase/poly-beta-1,6-N-acetylglucosamine synthase-like glycosyltransferase